MDKEEKTAAEEIREALATKFKAQILEQIDPELVRRYMGDVITEEVERLLRTYSFLAELGSEVKTALEKECTLMLASVMADPSTGQKIKKAVGDAVQKGIDEAAAAIGKRVKETLVEGPRRY